MQSKQPVPDSAGDRLFMRAALEQAEEAAEAGEVPVGAVIVKNGQIIGTGRNRTRQKGDPTAHAEMEAIHAALPAVGGWRLPGCDLYVTLEPCSMCAGALVHARLRRVIIGTADPKTGACGSVLNILQEPALNHHPEVVFGVMEQECAEVLHSFFRKLRRKNE